MLNIGYEADDIVHSNHTYNKSGQYTHKLFHGHSRAPTFMKMVLPKTFFTMREDSWNAYPYTKTIGNHIEQNNSQISVMKPNFY